MSLFWKIRRLKAMDMPEIVYRVAQWQLQLSERKLFSRKHSVYEVNLFGENGSADLAVLGINFENPTFTFGSDIELLGPYDYKDYRTRWLASFQGEGDWPVRFAHDYSFSDDDVPGDIRTNWELSRHRQFAVLAKSFYVTRNSCYLEELSELFDSWNEINPFMWGPEWASSMEAAIRLINWLVAAAFLQAAEDNLTCDLCARLTRGARVMAAQVRRHYSRFSSANNHTIVEAVGVGIAAVVFKEDSWLKESLSVLSNEIPKQTHADGVNREQALHYQLFVMEAICLLVHVLRASGRMVPDEWLSHLRGMARYVRECSVGSGRYMEFGDDDEGIILGLSQDKPEYADYVLSLVTMEMRDSERWVDDVGNCETVLWLYSAFAIRRAQNFRLVDIRPFAHFREGGVTIMRNERTVLAVDHGPLGFAPLAAHGHADALSVQLFVDGEPILIDPGTYVYNGNREMRNFFRSTAAHNTVCVDEGGQSEILGSFLWGRKARCSLLNIVEDSRRFCVEAVCDGYAPLKHIRRVTLSDECIQIYDRFEGGVPHKAFACFHFPNKDEVLLKDGAVLVSASPDTIVELRCSESFNFRSFAWSPAYGVLNEGVEIAAPVPLEGLVTTIKVRGKYLV